MTTREVDLRFIIEGPPAPTVRSFDFRFILEGLGPTATRDAVVNFTINGPEPSILVWLNDQWTPVAQRAWDGDSWFPPVV